MIIYDVGKPYRRGSDSSFDFPTIDCSVTGILCNKIWYGWPTTITEEIFKFFRQHLNLNITCWSRKFFLTIFKSNLSLLAYEIEERKSIHLTYFSLILSLKIRKRRNNRIVKHNKIIRSWQLMCQLVITMKFLYNSQIHPYFLKRKLHSEYTNNWKYDVTNNTGGLQRWLNFQ